MLTPKEMGKFGFVIVVVKGGSEDLLPNTLDQTGLISSKDFDAFVRNLAKQILPKEDAGMMLVEYEVV